MIDGSFDFAMLGSYLRMIKDINGDGFDEIVFGPSGFARELYVLFGQPQRSYLVWDELTTGFEGFLIKGGNSAELPGISVNGIGDVNADGFQDMMVGATASSRSFNYSGAGYVLFGKSLMPTLKHGEFSDVLLARTATSKNNVVFTGSDGAQGNLMGSFMIILFVIY